MLVCSLLPKKNPNYRSSPPVLASPNRGCPGSLPVPMFTALLELCPLAQCHVLGCHSFPCLTAVLHNLLFCHILFVINVSEIYTQLYIMLLAERKHSCLYHISPRSLPHSRRFLDAVGWFVRTSRRITTAASNCCSPPLVIFNTTRVLHGKVNYDNSDCNTTI